LLRLESGAVRTLVEVLDADAAARRLAAATIETARGALA
jgi:hypothetical protein